MNFQKKNLKILSFDCATKTMGVCYMHHNINWFENLKNKIQELSNTKIANSPKNKDENVLINIKKKLKIMKNEIKNVYNVKLLDFLNICFIDGIDNNIKNIDIITRTKMLNNKLKELDKFVEKNGGVDIVLLEKQMNISTNNNIILSQLIYHYNMKNLSIKIMGPSYKNTIYFTKELKLENILNERYDKYKANKKHSEKNLEYWIGRKKTIKLREKTKKLNKRNIEKIDDIGDAFLQSIAYIIRKKYNLSV